LRMREKDAQLNKLYGITLNNLGCYYKKYGHLNAEPISRKLHYLT
jgi:hypothetical protein